MTLTPPVADLPAGVPDAAPGSEQSQLYKSAVRFTRLYALFSPTMVGLLMAKKTRFGRFIPLPDALPDGFRLGGVPANGTAAVAGQQEEAAGVRRQVRRQACCDFCTERQRQERRRGCCDFCTERQRQERRRAGCCRSGSRRLDARPGQR